MLDLVGTIITTIRKSSHLGKPQRLKIKDKIKLQFQFE
jgi:hypothetical protein